MDPPMLILDEATSSIDLRTEQRVQKAFAKLMEGRTSFVIAHRLSTIKNSDTILVMKDGNIIEQGDHNELMDRAVFIPNFTTVSLQHKKYREYSRYFYYFICSFHI